MRNPRGDKVRMKTKAITITMNFDKGIQLRRGWWGAGYSYPIEYYSYWKNSEGIIVRLSYLIQRGVKIDLSWKHFESERSARREMNKLLKDGFEIIIR